MSATPPPTPATPKKGIPCQYRTGKTFATGLYSVVKEAIHIKTGERYACKVINKKLIEGKEHLVRNEIAVLKRISSGNPNVVTLHDYFETLHNHYLCFDLCTGGALFDRISAKGNYYEADAADLMRTIFTAVKYIHDAGIVHRNLKPENLFFRTPAEDTDIMLTDFGLSRIMEEEKLRMLTDICGTRYYMAPEIFLKTGYGKPVDVWALGVATYFLLAGYRPFDRDTPEAEMEAIIAGDYKFEPEEYWANVSDTARDFVRACLTIDPERRPTAAEALEHKWLASQTPRFVPDPSNPSGSPADLVPHVKKAFNAKLAWKKAIIVIRALNRMASLAGSQPLGKEAAELSENVRRYKEESEQENIEDTSIHNHTARFDSPASSSAGDPQPSTFPKIEPSGNRAVISAEDGHGSRLLEAIRQLLQHHDRPTDDLGVTLRALTWIFEKYDSTSVPLPPKVAMYAENLIEHINFRRLAGAENPDSGDSKDAETSHPHIASAFLAESTHNTELEIGRSFQNGLRLNDFNGRQAYVPLELCASWRDLCLFLDMFLRGDQESHFITRRNFGLRVPSERELLSRDMWDLWVSRFSEDVGQPPITLDLYAIMRDDSDSCPHCKIRSPVKHPLPDNLQQCVKCQFTFLEFYQDADLVSGTLRLSSPDNLDGPKGNSIPEDPSGAESPQGSNNAPGQFDFASIYSEPEQDMDSPRSEPADQPSLPNPFVSSAVQISGSSVPMNVQVIRRRKPVQQDSEDKQTSSTATDQALSTTTSTTPPPAPQMRPNSSKFLHVIYMFVLFGLPDRYRRDVPQPQDLGGNGDGACRTYKRWIHEWTQMGGIAGILFGVLFTVLQISSASYDPMVRTVVQLSIVCLFFGAVYAFILSMALGKLETGTEGLVWIRQATRHATRNLFWNPWIMLSMPLAWIIWGVFYFAFFILAFLWRSGAIDERDGNSKPSLHQEYGPRTITTLIFGVGVVYLILIVITVRGMGAPHQYVALHSM